jgi:hypothetical protein
MWQWDGKVDFQRVGLKNPLGIPQLFGKFAV